MLLDSIYTILGNNRPDADEVIYSIEINKDHDIYKGHFPGFPVTPGVVEVEIVKELLGVYLNQRVVLSKISSCRFTNILNPEDNALYQVRIGLKLFEPHIVVAADIFDDSKTYLSLSAEFSPLS
jgi:3-hydroxyacyl-[acyl-carrier-protein] dehydratase